jgi:hypothetical protein
MRSLPSSKEAAQCELLPESVAECFRDETSLLARQIVLSGDPREELIDERSEYGVALLESCGGRQVGPRAIELVELSDVQEALASDGKTGNSGFPKPTPRVTPTGDFGGR